MTYQPDRIFVKPTPLQIEGKPVPRVVRKPTGATLAAEGEWVNAETYWLRRVADGDVEQPENPPPEAEVTAAPVEPAEQPAPGAAPADASKTKK